VNPIVVTEMTATGHVYVREARESVGHRRTSARPGTREAVGCWSIAAFMPIIHGTTKPDCCATDDPTFLCPECSRRVCYCMGCDDDCPDLCADCWLKHQPGSETTKGRK
jgi:hypothetical protein